MTGVVGACGGGDSGSSPQPSPTPPVVSPTPAPSPTPSPATYVSLTDFSKNLFGESPVATATYVEVYDDNSPRYYVFKEGSAELNRASGAGIFTWDADEASATSRIGNEFLTFPSSSISAQQEHARSFYIAEDDGYSSLLWTGLKDGVLGILTLERNACGFPLGQPKTCTTTTRYANIGPLTLPGELPVSGSVSYKVYIQGTLAIRDYASSNPYGQILVQTDLAVDFSSKIVSANWSAGGRDFILQGEFYPGTSARLSGTIRSVDGRMSGQFVGNFYGAGASEVGIVFSLDGENGGFAGGIAGR